MHSRCCHWQPCKHWFPRRAPAQSAANLVTLTCHLCLQLLMLMPLLPAMVALLLLTLMPLHASGEMVPPKQVSVDRVLAAHLVIIVADGFGHWLTAAHCKLYRLGTSTFCMCEAVNQATWLPASRSGRQPSRVHMPELVCESGQWLSPCTMPPGLWAYQRHVLSLF
jgi:hypothetical protein